MYQTFTRFSCLLILALAAFVSPANGAGKHPAAGLTDSKSLEFVQNRNQWDSRIKYHARLAGGDLYLLQNRWVYHFYDGASMPKHHDHENATPAAFKPEIKAHAYSVTFVGANQNPALTTQRPTPGHRNYFIGNNPSRWASEVKAFEEVQYQELYKGITAKIYEHGQKLKYDFVLEAGADPKQIRMQYEGTENLQIVNGDLQIRTSINMVTEQKPYAYQIINGKEQEVPCKFVLKGNEVTFAFPKGYRKKLPLIIDPTLVYSTYSGSTADNWGFTATYDDAGNIYSGGVVFYNVAGGGNFPVTAGAFQIVKSGASDVGIMKFNPNASGPASRVWATYLGGNGTEAPHSLVVNSQNELLILGTTSSNNFPTPNGFDTSFNGGTLIDPLSNSNVDYLMYQTGSDLFVSKLNAAGTAMVGSTYLGGNGNDGLLTITSPLVKNYGDQFRGDITVDAADNVYIASSTNSANFPLQNAFQVTQNGFNDAVVSKLSPNLNSLLWSSYLGGSGVDAAYSIQIDTQNNVYVCGGTTSANLAQTAGAWKTTNGLGIVPVDGFVSKITVTNNVPSLFRTSYIGTTVGQTGGLSGYDQAYFLQLDASNNVYLLGQSSGSYPIVQPTPAPPTFYSTANGRQFIQKLSSDLTTSIFSTRFGSTSGQFNISPTAFLVDNCERIFICGWGGSTNNLNISYVGGTTTGLPVTPNAMKTTTDGNDIYLAQFTQNMAQLEYATFFGGNQTGTGEHVDGGTCRFDKRGIVYHSLCGGCSNNSSFPATPNAWSTVNASQNCNNAAFKFDFAVTSAIAGDSQLVCINAGPTQITGATPPGGVWSGTGVTQSGIFTPTPALIGTHVLTYTSTVGACVSFATKTVTVVPLPQVTFSGLKNSEYCLSDDSVKLIPSRPGGTFSGRGLQPGNFWNPSIAGPGTHAITYTFTDSVTKCSVVITDSATVAAPITVNAGIDEGLCATSEPIQLTGATPAGGVWSGNGVTANGIFRPSTALIGPQTLTYTLTQDNCKYSATKVVTVNPVPMVNATLENGNCGTDSTGQGFAPLKIRFQNNTTLGESFVWDFGDGTTSTEPNPEHVYEKAGTYVVKLKTDFGRGCVRESVVNTITVSDYKMPNIITPNGDGLNDYFVPMITCNPMTLKIYSRWGHVVYERDNYKGEFNAEKVSAGMYYYQLRDSEGRKWKGWLEIVK